MHLRNLQVFTPFYAVALAAVVTASIGACCPCKSSADGESGDAQAGSFVERLSKWTKKQDETSGDNLDPRAQPKDTDSGSTANEVLTGGSELTPIASKVFENLKSEGFSPVYPVKSNIRAGLSTTVGVFADGMSVTITEFDSEMLAKNTEKALGNNDSIRVFRKGKAVISLGCGSMDEVRCTKAGNAVSK